MDKENTVNVFQGILMSPKEKYHVICRKMDGTGDHHAE
jgi:hypothetical protein